MMSQWIEFGGATVALIGLVVVGRAFVGVCDDRDQWRGAAMELARVVRPLDCYPVVENAHTVYEARAGEKLLERGSRMTFMPIPTSVAVVGREGQLDRWSLSAASALSRYDRLLKPEGDDR